MKKQLLCIFAGLVFFFNPVFNMFDMLPDFLGCIIISLALTKLSFIDENLYSAKKCAVYYGFVSLARVVFSMWANASHTDYLLPFTFSFAVLDAIFLTALFRNLYTGLDYLANRSNAQNVRASLSNAYSMSVIFTFVTRILEFCPQIVEIFRQNDELDLSYTAHRKIPLYALKPYISAFCFIVMTLVGILFIIITARFFIKLSKNHIFLASAEQKYQDNINADRESFVCTILPGIFTFIAAGLFFMYNFSVDAVNVLATFISPVLFFIAFSKLKHLDKTLRLPYVLFIICLVSTTANYIYSTFVNLGINYLFSAESFNVLEFAFLQNKASVAVSVLLCMVEMVSLLALLFKLYSALQKVLCAEKRTLIASRLFFCRINTLLLCICSFVHTLTRAFLGHLATNDDVNKFISMRAVMTTDEQIAQSLENPLVNLFDKADSFNIVLGVIFALVMLWNVLYVSGLKTKSE